MTKKADPFTEWEVTQEDPETNPNAMVEILKELEGVHEKEPLATTKAEDFTEMVEIQLQPTIPPST